MNHHLYYYIVGSLLLLALVLAVQQKGEFLLVGLLVGFLILLAMWRMWTVMTSMLIGISLPKNRWLVLFIVMSYESEIAAVERQSKRK